MPGFRLLAALCLPIWLTASVGCTTAPINGEPDLLLVEGKKLYEKKGYREAQRRFKGVVKFHPDSDEAEESAFLDSECRRHRRQSTPAFDAYKAFIKTYPNSRYSVGVALGEYELGTAQLRGENPGFLFFAADKGYGVRILEHMQINFRNHGLADDALMHVANYQLKQDHYDEAADTLKRLLAEYPRREHMLWARFQLARSLWLQNEGPLYDDRLLTRARRAFEDYIGTAKLMGQAERQQEQIDQAHAMIVRIDERRSEKEYLVGRFYERTGRPHAAVYDDRHCVRSFPGTKHAKESQDRLQTVTAKLETAAKTAEQKTPEKDAG